MHDPILYSTDHGQAALQLHGSDGSACQTRRTIAAPFVSGKQHTSLHIRTIPDQGEPSPATLEQFLTVRSEGGRQLYNLDSPLAVRHP